jgi:hypothetical protein
MKTVFLTEIYVLLRGAREKTSKAYAERYVFIGRAHEKENPTRRRDGRI